MDDKNHQDMDAPLDEAEGDMAFDEIFEDSATENAPATPERTENGVQEASKKELESYKLQPSDFTVKKCIGTGAYGKVLLCRHNATKQIVAVKVMKKTEVVEKRSVKTCREERDILSLLHHPFIVECYACFQTHRHLYIVMEYVSGGELFYHIEQKGFIREEDAMIYIAEVVLALEHLHAHKIIHRDVKPENLLLGSDGHVVLTDFGLSKLGDESNQLKSICGTDEYLAPEMIAKTGYGKEVDWWALGILVYEMLTGDLPFKHKHTPTLFKLILSKKVKMPPHLTPVCHSFIKGLLCRDVSQRLGCRKSSMFKLGGVKELQNHPYFKNLDWTLLAKKGVDPPYKPELKFQEDTSNFSPTFTSMPVSTLSPKSVKIHNKHLVAPDLFRGFSWTDQNATLANRNHQTIAEYEEEEVSEDNIVSDDEDAAQDYVDLKLTEEDNENDTDPAKYDPTKQDSKTESPSTITKQNSLVIIDAVRRANSDGVKMKKSRRRKKKKNTVTANITGNIPGFSPILTRSNTKSIAVVSTTTSISMNTSASKSILRATAAEWSPQFGTQVAKANTNIVIEQRKKEDVYANNRKITKEDMSSKNCWVSTQAIKIPVSNEKLSKPKKQEMPFVINKKCAWASSSLTTATTSKTQKLSPLPLKDSAWAVIARKRGNKNPTPKTSAGITHAATKVGAWKSQRVSQGLRSSRGPRRKTPERRLDDDGLAYTRAEFITFYGSDARWKKAKVFRPHVLRK